MATDDAVIAVYKYAVELVKSGLSASEAESKLIEQGLEKDLASIVIKNVLNLRLKAVKDAGKKNMLWGAIWCIGGITVTLVTYSAASGGGSYIIAWGAIIFGAIQFFRGLSQYNSQ